MRGRDGYGGASGVETRQRVLQSHAEPADDLRMPALLGVLLLRKVLVPQSAAAVYDVPASVPILKDRRLRGPGEHLLIKGVGDQLADREGDRPVLEHLLDIQVKGLRSMPK